MEVVVIELGGVERIDETDWQAAQVCRRGGQQSNEHTAAAGGPPDAADAADAAPGRPAGERGAAAAAAAARPESSTQTNGGGDGWWMIMGSMLACAEGSKPLPKSPTDGPRQSGLLRPTRKGGMHAGY